MSPEQEQTLVSKVNAIHDALVGPLGIQENGIIWQVNDHGKRIVSLERWRWYIAGGVVTLIGLLKLAAMAIGK